MILFEPLGEEIRIVLPDGVGAVVHGRVRLFLSDNADAYTATASEGSQLGTTGKSEPATIYHAIGLDDAMVAELAGMILANSKPAAAYVGAPHHKKPGRFR
jgi:hypothetical protein